ncbi:hypothetical protein [Azospirillum brasilense]|uniref:hypothetical protein n=1 Tax=Azospirillum brasilense TaxID=192 RepID=UPI0015524010|nr:hypothetical protein [Azospirillum brasilense]
MAIMLQTSAETVVRHWNRLGAEARMGRPAAEEGWGSGGGGHDLPMLKTGRFGG